MSTSRRTLGALVLVLATLAVFLPALGNGFLVLDDGAYVTANPMVQRGLSAESLRWALTANVTGHWHPLTLVSHMLDVELFGPSARGHHLTSVLLHALNAGLVFLVFQGLSGAAGRSFVLAAVWALHPLRVESVAWIAERKDVLSGTLFLLLLLAYGGWARRRRPTAFVACLLLFALGLMAKAMLVTVPIVLLLLDVWPLGRLRARPDLAPRVVEKLPFLALSAVSVAATLRFQSSGLIAQSSFPPLGRAANAVIGLAQYARATVWPSGLAALYPLPAAIPWLALAFALGLGIAATWTAWRTRRSVPAVGVGWLWLAVMLLPVLGFLQVGAQAWADRYSYLPTLGLLVALVWGAWALLCRWRLQPAVPLAAVLLTGVTLAEARATRAQIATWRNDFTVWNRALEVTRSNYVAEVNFGLALLRAGRAAPALPHLRRAAAIAPASMEARAALGEALRESGDFAAAIAELRAAVRLAPLDPRPHTSLAHAFAQAGDRAAALAELREAARLDPEDASLGRLIRGLEVPVP